MKIKTAAFFLTLFPLCIHAHSEKAQLELSLSQNTNLQQSNWAVSLENLQVNVLYKIRCTIQASENANSKILFEPRLLASSSYGNVELNEQPLPTNSNYLNSGKNVLAFHVLIGKEDIEKYNRFLLSSSSDMQVETCQAYEETPDSAASQAKIALNSDGGYFFAYNHTDQVVTIGVGNFFPTEYTIQPHDWRTVFVSTDNQNIHIQKIK